MTDIATMINTMSATTINTIDIAIKCSVTIKSINLMKCWAKCSVMTICVGRERIYVKREEKGREEGREERKDVIVDLCAVQSIGIFILYSAYTFVYTL